MRLVALSLGLLAVAGAARAEPDAATERQIGGVYSNGAATAARS